MMAYIDDVKQHCKKYKYSKQYTDYWASHTACEVCQSQGMLTVSAAPHHIRTRGAGGTDEHRNLLALCAVHHTLIGSMGVQTFANKHPRFKRKIFDALDVERVGMS